jgi:hypothetical protein
MAIAKDFGWFLAALMKKDFSKTTGIEYIAVGGSRPGGKVVESDFSEEKFEERVRSFFEEMNNEDKRKDFPIYWPEKYKDIWIWAMPLLAIEYYDDPKSEGGDGNKSSTFEAENTRYEEVRNKIKITASFGNEVPFKGQNLEFREFALLAIDTENGKFLKDKLFFISYDWHGIITKSQDMTITRNVILTFSPQVKSDVTLRDSISSGKG